MQATDPIDSIAQVVMRVVENIPAFVLLYFMWQQRDRDYRQEKSEHDALTERYLKHFEDAHSDDQATD